MINKDFEQVLVGSLFGDGCLTIKKDQKNPVYTENHSLKQEDYLKWKNKFFCCKLTKYQYFDRRTNKIYFHCQIRTRTNPIYTYYHKLFYPKGKKTINEFILSKLNLLGIAVWFCDDGCYNYRNENIYIATKGFSIGENRIICNYFKKKYNLDFKIDSVNNIYLDVEGTKKFKSLIKDFVPRYMHYKLGYDNKRRKESKKNKQK